METNSIVVSDLSRIYLRLYAKFGHAGLRGLKQRLNQGNMLLVADNMLLVRATCCRATCCPGVNAAWEPIRDTQTRRQTDKNKETMPFNIVYQIEAEKCRTTCRRAYFDACWSIFLTC